MCVTAAALLLPALTSCNDKGGNADTKPESPAAQRDVNAIIATIDNYALSVKNATSVEEISELDSEFAKAIGKYADSTDPVNAADRQAILSATERLSITINGRVKDLEGQAPMTLEEIQEQKDILAADLDKCKTVGQVVQMATY